MMLAEFDSRGFADAVADVIAARGKGEYTRALRRTGIPTGTFHRMINGSPPRSIGAILSAAAYFDIRLAPFVKVRPGDND